MPFVRIDLLEGKTPEFRAQVGQIVYCAMIETLDVPKDDRFQIITEHPKTSLHFRSRLSWRPSLGRLHFPADHA